MMGMMAVFFKDRKIRPQYVVRIPIQFPLSHLFIKFLFLNLQTSSWNVILKEFERQDFDHYSPDASMAQSN